MLIFSSIQRDFWDTREKSTKISPESNASLINTLHTSIPYAAASKGNINNAS